MEIFCIFAIAICLLRQRCPLRKATGRRPVVRNGMEPMGGALHCGISDTVRFVFDYLNYHNQISFKDICRGDAYGCVYHTQPECAEGHLKPSRTLLGALYILLRVSNLFVL